MSNLIYGRWTQYFQVPVSDEVENLSLAGYRLYAHLCREMNVRSAVEQHYSNQELSQATGIKDHKTMSKARRELQTARLVACHKVPPGVYAYIMLDQRGDPIPPPKSRTGIRRHSPRNGRRQTTLASGAGSIAHSDRPAPVVATLSPPTPRCRVHGLAPHWDRNGDLVCELCHPNPNAFRPPTARDLGF